MRSAFLFALLPVLAYAAPSILIERDSCETNTFRCSGNTLQQCDHDTWYSQKPCPAGTVCIAQNDVFGCVFPNQAQLGSNNGAQVPPPSDNSPAPPVDRTTKSSPTPAKPTENAEETPKVTSTEVTPEDVKPTSEADATSGPPVNNLAADNDWRKSTSTRRWSTSTRGSSTAQAEPTSKTSSTRTRTSTTAASQETKTSSGGNNGSSGSGNLPSQGQKTGTITFYGEDSQTACGGPVTYTDAIVAVSTKIWNKSMCGQYIKVTNGGKSVVVRVADSCASCDANHIDLSSSAFQQISQTSVGQFTGQWEWTDGSGYQSSLPIDKSQSGWDSY